MTKSELINKISEGSGIAKKEVEKVLVAQAKVIIEALEKGEKVKIPELVTFEVKEVAAKDGRNPSNGESIHIPAHNAVKTKPVKSLKDIIR